MSRRTRLTAGRTGALAGHGFVGKAILFAPQDAVVVGFRYGLSESSASTPRSAAWSFPHLSDVPRPGSRIRAGRPITTVWAVAESIDDPNRLWVVDVWTSQEAHTQALKAPEMRPFVEQAMPLLERMPEQIEVRVVGGKGVPG